jgi:signal transduction histidine kinase
MMDARQRERLLAWADRFLPDEGPHVLSVEDVRRVRLAVAQAALGFLSTLAMCGLYAALGSPLSALAIACVSVGLALVPWLLRRGVSAVTVGNLTIALAYGATLTVALRSGGPASPAVVWSFLLPLAVYAVSGRASAMLWTALAGALLVGPAAGPRARAWSSRRTFSRARSWCCGSLGMRVSWAPRSPCWWPSTAHAPRRSRPSARRELALDRQRILDDMHDGVGSHVLGLLVQSRAGTLHEADLVAGLESCLDDLRLIVDSLDPQHASLSMALGALRARVAPRCEGLGVTLTWDVDPELTERFTPAAGMQVMRALQELLNNALRHAQAQTVTVRIAARAGGTGMEVAVLDDGVGLAGEGSPKGRGMKSLRTRARKLGGALVVAPRSPGLRVAIELPVPPTSRDGEGGPRAL